MSTPETTIDDSAVSGRYRILQAAAPQAEKTARAGGGRGRQAAISRNLGNLSNYKRWAEKVRGGWDDDATGA